MEIVIKLDRLKLPNASNTPAESIFQEISTKTGALVLWESGSKTIPVRREPCIKISGTEESVKKAKESLLERLEVQSNRVVLKMEVTHQEHPSLIGKGGKLIKKVMEATGCHIHFPDDNKSNTLVKKNQVSIYGDPINVERARVMLRALIPIQMYFEVPKTSLNVAQVQSSIHPNCDCSLSGTKFVGNFNGLLLYTPLKQSNIVIIRCNQDQFSDLRKDITMLMEHICCTKGANLPPVNMVTDIMQQHHVFVKGHNNSNIEGIMKRTGAKITFPDINSPLAERRAIAISGSLDSVYVAWLEIMNYLPVNVSFDVNATRETKGEYMDFLRDLGITLLTRPNPKYYIKNVTLRGPEKFSKQMLQYRQHVLHLPSLCFKPDIEDINLASNFLTSLSEYFQSSAVNAISSSVSNIISRNIGFETVQQLTQDLNGASSHKQLLAVTNNPVIPVISNGSIETGYFITSTNDFKMQSCPLLLAVEQSKTSGTGQTTQNENGCYWKSKMGGNLITQDQLLTNNNWIKNIPFENVSSGFTEMSHSQSLAEQNGTSSRLPQSLFIENQNRETTLAEDYYRKKILAARAMRRPIKSMESAQVPTSLWAGCGFSQSMPAAVIKDSLDSVNQYNRCQFSSCSSNSSSEDSESWENMMKDCIDGDSIWSNKKEATFSHSNYFDLSRNRPVLLSFNNSRNQNTRKDILPELLWQRGLHKYIDTFTKEEIDFDSFLLLTDSDLQIMGIAQQARVKLVCLIREMQESTMKYKTFDAAPGAERKSSIDRMDDLQIC